MRTSYLLLILHKNLRYSFRVISVRYGAFYAALWYSLSPEHFERLRTQLSSFLHQFCFCGKVWAFSSLRYVFAIYRLQLSLDHHQGLCAKPFFLGDEYIVYYIQGLTSPTTAAREGTMVYLRVIIIWELCEMLNFQYKKSDFFGITYI